LRPPLFSENGAFCAKELRQSGNRFALYASGYFAFLRSEKGRVSAQDFASTQNTAFFIFNLYSILKRKIFEVCG